MKINKIVVVGGGSSGWMTAATLVKEFPTKDITVIESKDVPIIGVGESTLGGIRNWTSFIGLDEHSFFKHTDASYKLSIKFTDFYKKDFGSFHYPFGKAHKVAENRNPMEDWHMKKYFYPETDSDDFTDCLFPASSLFKNNKYSSNEFQDFGDFNPNTDVAYHFDAIKFGIWLRDQYCIPAGVKHVQATVTGANVSEEGIEYLILDNNEHVLGDLYIDCTGFSSLLLGQYLKEPFDSFSDILPNNRAWATQIKYKDKTKELEGYTNCTAIENGWCWNIPLWSRLGTGYVYSDKFVTPEEAKQQFKNYLMSNKMVVPRTQEEVDSLEFKNISMRVGIHKKTFVKNVVAIGLSAGFIEPLESNGLFTVHEFLFSLLDVLQREDISQFDRDMYNIDVKNTFTNFASFVALHYALSHRDDTEYWRDIKNRTVFNLRNFDPATVKERSKVDGFYDVVYRYMDQWAYANDNNGIQYIATGLQLYMLNNQRALRIQKHSGKNLIGEINNVIDIWDVKKKRWQLAAKNSPTLEEYLFKNFYS